MAEIRLADGGRISVDDDWRIAGGLPDRTVQLAKNLDAGIYEEANDQGCTVTHLLEKEDPSDGDLPDFLRGTDAYQRQLLALGIRTRGDWVRGIAPHTLEEFYDAGGGRGALLVPEFFSRTYRMASLFGMRALSMRNPHLPMGTERFYASNQPVDESLRPDSLASAIQADSLRSSLLPLLIAVEEQGDGKPYRSFHVTHAEASERLIATSEGAELGTVTITGSERTHDMEPFGRAIHLSYKVAAEWSLPLVQFHLTSIAGQVRLDKEQKAYDTLFSGDGVASGASNTNITSLVGGAAGTVTVKNLIEFLRLFEGNGDYQPTVAVGPSDVVLEVETADLGSANHMAFLGLTPVFPGQGARPESRQWPPMYSRDYATANKILVVDGTKSLRMRFTPLLQETDRIIQRRVDVITMSEETGFDILLDNGRRTLDIQN